jgi:hypothetical protein
VTLLACTFYDGLVAEQGIRIIIEFMRLMIHSIKVVDKKNGVNHFCLINSIELIKILDESKRLELVQYQHC